MSVLNAPSLSQYKELQSVEFREHFASDDLGQYQTQKDARSYFDSLTPRVHKGKGGPGSEGQARAPRALLVWEGGSLAGCLEHELSWGGSVSGKRLVIRSSASLHK